MNIEEDVSFIISEILGIEPLTVDVNSNLLEYYHITSMQLINLVTQLENRFDFNFDYTDVNEENFKCISSISILLKKYLEKA